MKEFSDRKASQPAPVAEEERCVCGNLLARLTPGGVEILCRRCKRKHVVRWAVQQSEDEVVTSWHRSEN